MKVLVLSKYSRKGASSRYRMYQYFPYLKSQGLAIDVQPLFNDAYLDALYSKKSRLLLVLKAYCCRFFQLIFSKRYDFVWVEKELFPWTPWFIERLFFLRMNTPYVVDYDDAIFHQYDQHRFRVVRKVLGRKCDMVMQSSAMVIAGNSYLAERAFKAGAKRVREVPTVVSKEKFFPKMPNNSIPIIGWIGSMSTATYLEKLKPILKELSSRFLFKIRVVGAEVYWDDLPIECIHWEESQEVESVQSFDIGIMPLHDSPWERGKCGFKLIQYMACGKPVVADAIGANRDIVLDSEVGYLVSSEEEWRDSLEFLLKDNERRRLMGNAGRLRFVEKYSLETAQVKLLELFSSLRSEG